jgi:hypothetical protein
LQAYEGGGLLYSGGGRGILEGFDAIYINSTDGVAGVPDSIVITLLKVFG